MFSSRLPANLSRNRLAAAVEDARADGAPLLDLTESNPTRAGFRYPEDLLAPLSDSAGLRYAPDARGLRAAREAVASEYERQGVTLSADRIVLTASTSEAYGFLFKLLADAGDEVLVPRPSYPLFEHLSAFDLLRARPYDLDVDGAWAIDFTSVERALSPRTRAVLVVSPNNPTGSFLGARECERLAALCAPRGIAIIADEVFQDYELTPGARAAAARPLSQADALVFSLGGLSKSAGLPQVKLGWIGVGGPERLVASALERLDLIADTYLSVSTPAQLGAPALIERGAAVRRQIIDRVRRNHAAAAARLDRAPACRLLPSGGGWSAVIQVPAVRSEEDMVLEHLAQDRVLAHPGYFFDFPREAFLVVSLLPPPDVFDEGLDRLVKRHG